MKISGIVIIALIAFLVLLQYKLWFSTVGITEYKRLKLAIFTTEQQNQALEKRNEAVVAEVRDLKAGGEAIEERARNGLGLVKPNETFYQIVP